MRIEDFEREYQIREFQVKSQRLQTELSWKFKTASHFLVFIYDSRYEFEIEEAVEMAMDAKNCWLEEKTENFSCTVFVRKNLSRTKRRW